MAVATTAKAALLLTDKKTWQKIGTAVIAVALIFSLLFSLFDDVRLEETGMDVSVLFAGEISKYQAVFEGGKNINTKLLFACYTKLFDGKTQYGSPEEIASKLILCFIDDSDKLKIYPIEDTDIIFDRIESSFNITLNVYMRKKLLELAERMPDGLTDRSILTRNLTATDGKTNIGLVNFAYNALDAGSSYIYGAYGQDTTMEYLKRQQILFAGDIDANLTNAEVDFIYKTFGGKPSFDCIGLIKAYEWIDEKTGRISYGSNGFRDMGANGTALAADETHSMSTLPEIPGLAVWMDGHIGVYIGDGEVIEANSNHVGVIKSKLPDNGWTNWFQFPGITYVTAGTFVIHNQKVRIENGRIAEIVSSVVSGKGSFDWPLAAPYGKNYITSGAEARMNPVTGRWENSHGAVDIGAPQGTEILAAADGTVTAAYWSDSYGNFVMIDHGKGWSTVYAHSSQLLVITGQYVHKGQPIALVGTTGWSTGNHLHFEIREDDTRLDPMQFFD